jgi:hypothetical protein
MNNKRKKKKYKKKEFLGVSKEIKDRNNCIGVRTMRLEPSPLFYLNMAFLSEFLVSPILNLNVILLKC